MIIETILEMESLYTKCQSKCSDFLWVKNKSRRILEENPKESKENGEWIKSTVGDVAFSPFLNILPLAKGLIISLYFSNYDQDRNKLDQWDSFVFFLSWGKWI